MKSFNLKQLFFWLPSLLLVAIVMHLVSAKSNETHVDDLRVRTAIYQAVKSAIAADQISIKAIDPATYAIEDIQSIDVRSLETGLQNELIDQGFASEIELGLFRHSDDSLMYGCILTDVPINSSLGEINLNQEMGNLMIHLPQNTLAAALPPSIWQIGGVILIVVLIVFVLKYRAGMARHFKSVISSEVTNTNAQSLGVYAFDPRSQVLSHPTTDRKLTHKEAKLLSLFIEKPNEVIDRDSILKAVWHDDGFYVARSMDVFISKLRKYLALDSSIQLDNVRGIGYVLRCH